MTALTIAADGRPLLVALDPLLNAIDDEVSYRIERFEELPVRPPPDR